MIEIKRKEFRFFSVVIAMALILGMIPKAQVRAAEVKNYYVDPVKGNDSRNGTVSRPLKTVGKALEKAKDFFSENEGAEVTINLKDGEYRISDTLVIDEKLMNNGKLTLQAHDGGKPVISGGQSIDGWSLYDGEKNIYAASLSGANPRQLYVNGKRAVRARTPDRYLSDKISFDVSGGKYTGYRCSDTEPLSWSNVEDIEFVYSEEWANHRCKISSVVSDTEGAVINMADDFNMLCRIDWGTAVDKNTSYYLENAYEFLDSQREFYVDTQKQMIFYKPSDDENMNTAQILYPSVTTLLRLKNIVVDRRISNVTLSGIGFMYSDWQYHNEIDAFLENQNNIDIYGRKASAAIVIEGAENVLFSGCTVANTGGDGIQWVGGVKNCTMEDCRIYNTAAGAITFGGVEEADILGLDANRLIEKNTIQNCTVYNTGLDYRGAAAVTLGAVSDMFVHHNEIYNTSYSALHIGWGWNNYADRTVALKNISVKYNYLHDIMVSTIQDGGAVYTLGKNMGGCVTAYNYIKNQYQKASCLYNDEGTNDWVTHHNVVDNSMVTTWTPRWMHWHKDTIVRCHMYDNYADSDVDYRNSPTSVMERLTIVSDGNWPESAQNIMQHAGTGKTDLEKTFFGRSENDGEELFGNGGFDESGTLLSDWTINPSNTYAFEKSFENTYGASAGSLKITVLSEGQVLEKQVSLRRNSYYHFSAKIKPDGVANDSVTVIPYIEYNGVKQSFEEQQANGNEWTDIQAYFQPPAGTEWIDYSTDYLQDTYTVGVEIKDTLGSTNIVYADEVKLNRYCAYYNANLENNMEGWKHSDSVTTEWVEFDPAEEGVLELIQSGDFPNVSRVAHFSSGSAAVAGISQNFAFEKNTVYDVSYWIKAGEVNKKLATIAFPLGKNAAFAKEWPYAIWAKTDLKSNGWTHIQYQIAFGDSDTVQAFDSRLELRYANAADAGENAVPGDFYMAEFKVEKTRNIIRNPFFLFGSAATRSADDKDWSQNAASTSYWEENTTFSALNNQEQITPDGAKACGQFIPTEENPTLYQTVSATQSGSYGISAWVQTTGDAVFSVDGIEIPTSISEYNGWKKLTAKYDFKEKEPQKIGVKFNSNAPCLFKDFMAIPLQPSAHFEKIGIFDSDDELTADENGVYREIKDSVKIRGNLKNTDKAMLIVAGYSKDYQLMFLKTESVAEGVFEKTVPLDTEISSLKLFAWDSFLNMRPIHFAISAK